jgi:dehydrogenase/reductase SDR family protein 7B
MADRRVAWVTGASSGIGEALAKALGADGWSVILSGRRVEALQDVAGRISGQTLILPFEATDMDALPALAAQAIAWKGQVDLLINNAGVSQRSLGIDTDFAVYRTIMEIDYFAPLRLTQLVLPHMVARRSGRIAAISSIAGRVGSPMRTGYCSAKFALLGYFEALRAEIEQAYGVKVTTILPGSVRTAVAANALQQDGSRRGVSDENIDAGMDPDEAARLILEAFEADRRELIIGAEAGAAHLRFADPDRLFDALAREGARLAAARDAQGGGVFQPQPARHN